MSDVDPHAGNVASRTAKPTYRIRPRRGVVDINWSELWQFRDLLFLLALRDVKVRYKQTVIGAAWAVVQPLATMLVFTVVFGAILGRGNEPSPEGVPYPVSTFCALLPWQFFAHALTASSNSLIENEKLITKIYFPRLFIPCASTLSGLLDFCISFLILLGLMAFYGIMPTASIVILPFFLVLAILTALGMGLWLSALNALYRDVRYTIPFVVQIGMFITPVVYPASSVLPSLPGWAQVLYMLNPMAGVVEGFRWTLLGSTPPEPSLLAISTVGTILLFLGGMVYFRRMDSIFADWI